MNFMLGEASDSSAWRSYFDMIICSSDKPNFYTSKRPFRKWNVAMGCPSTISVSSLVKGDVYINGSVHALQRSTGWVGRRILYVGDNLFADLVEARKHHGWQTACIIGELERELVIQYGDDFQRFQALRSSTRQLISALQLHMERNRRKAIQANEALSVCAAVQDQPVCRVENVGDACNIISTLNERRVIVALEEHLKMINSTMSGCFNRQFGSAFRSDGSPSMFAFSIRRFVLISVVAECILV